jgi:predicted nucleic acid-binding Zn ribbon protein
MRGGKTKDEVVVFRHCEACGRKFKCSRRHAKTCSDRCRLWRWRNDLRRKAEVATAAAAKKTA